MRKAFTFGIISSFFFAFTFILNRSMHLSGGSWIWSASLRYLFTLPMIALLVWRSGSFARIHSEIKKHTGQWILWSFFGFVLFYAPLSFASAHGESWLTCATWQLVIVMGLLLAPFFGKSIPLKNFFAAVIILIGVFILQISQADEISFNQIGIAVIPIIVASIVYPLGNRKIMALCGSEITTIERIYGMTLCSYPFWILLSIFGIFDYGLPSGNQLLQSFLVALFSGVLATIFFFKATDMVKHSQKQLAIVESTQACEVVFALLGSIIFLGDALPTTFGIVGLVLIIAGIIADNLI